ncbi:hypothetical protein T484DRAFT_2419715 [Baffinella frigidus]|nr:hypothetical protein T484DRAFT_2419715 [Cryptophyta sp. CCMP2293]
MRAHTQRQHQPAPHHNLSAPAFLGPHRGSRCVTVLTNRCDCLVRRQMAQRQHHPEPHYTFISEDN